MRLDTLPVPEVKPGWVILKTRVVQPSITEVIRSQGLATGSSDDIKKAIEERAPVQLFGHEFCAEVIEVGDGVKDMMPGDRVVGGAKIPCGECSLCRSGTGHLCRRGPHIGIHIPGMFAEYGCVPAVALAKVPDTISDSEGACIQPLTAAVTAAETADIEVGDTVAVFGQGVMGLGCMQVARSSGAREVIGVDIRTESLELATKLGADHVVNATKVDPVKAIIELTDGFGVDVVFETAGGSRKQGLAGTETIMPAISSVRDCGKVIQVAQIGETAQLDLLMFRKKNVVYKFSRPQTPRTLLHTIALVATKRVQVAPLVTHILDGIEKVPDAFEITSNKAKYGALNPAQVVVHTG
jgi:threonine dehydrogenase-like Zn-dependent dehydrogenase